MSQPQIALSKSARADVAGAEDGGTHEVALDLAYKRLTMVNVVFVGQPGSDRWVLIDTAIPGSFGPIVNAAERRFGKVPPQAILLTHGHFDHAHNAKALAEHWNVPIYAHPLERPYLIASASYPPADISVGGGLVTLLSPLFPSTPTDLSGHLRLLPEDGSVPAMPGWQWVHTPGHTPGHVSFWRPADKTLIAGDAFITTRVESAYAVATQEPEMHGPPMFLTPDWAAAHESVRKLSDLEPELAITGHGRAMRGLPMRAALRQLALNFVSIAMPARPGLAPG